MTGDAFGPGLEHVTTMWAEDHCSRALGIEAVRVDTADGRGRAVARMTVREDMVNGHGTVHGGLIFTLADSAFALTCNATGDLTVAAGCDIVFVAPARLGDVLVASGEERARFGRSGLTDVTVIRESDGALIAEFRGRSRSLPTT